MKKWLKRNWILVSVVCLSLSVVSYPYAATITKALIGKEDINWKSSGTSRQTFNRLSSRGRTLTLNQPDAKDLQFRSVADEVESLIDGTLGVEYSSHYTDLDAAIAAFGATERTLIIDSALTVTANAIVPTTMGILVFRGGSFNNGASTVTVNGPLIAGRFKILDGSGALTFGTEATDRAFPEWWDLDGTADDVQINLAHDSITKGIVSLAPGKTYNTTGTITINKNRVSLIGGGQQSTIISFNPASTIPAVHLVLAAGGATVVQNTLKGFAIDAAGDTATTKVALRITDSEETIVEDIAISNFTSTANDDIGLQYRGRQTLSMKNSVIVADIPISIEDNPNTTIDIDHAHFQDLLLTADLTQPVIQIADGVNLSNVTFDGYQAWVQGKHGLFWSDTTTAAVSFNLSIKNVRWEQATDATGDMIHIAHNRTLQQLSIKNMYGGLNSKGIFLENVLNVDLENIFYIGTGVGLDIDSTNQQVNLKNVVLQTGATATVTAPKITGSYWTEGGSNERPFVTSTNVVTLTAAQVNALRAAPQTIVGAMGATTVLEFVSAVLDYNHDTTAFTVAGDEDLVIQYGTGQDVTAAIETTGFLDQANDETRLFSLDKTALPETTDLTALKNSGLAIFNTGAGETADGGASTLKVAVTYRVHWNF